MLFGKKKAAPTRQYLDFSFPTANNVTIQADDLKADEVTVKKADYFTPLPPVKNDNGWGFISFNFTRETYKQAHAQSSARVLELESFLEDLLIVDPRLNRFDAAEFSKKGKRKTPFKWNVAAVHDAAELIRSDKAEAERRDALKELQGGGE